MEQPIHQDAGNENIGLLSLIVAALRHWRFFLYTFLCTLVIAIVYLIVVPDTYNVSMRIMVQEDDSSSPSFGLGEAAGLMKSFGLGKLGGGSVSIDDEMVILSSNTLLRKVIRTLGLQVVYAKPGSLLHKLHSDNTPLLLNFSTETGDRVSKPLDFKIRIAGDGAVSVKVKELAGPRYDFSFSALPAVISLPQGDFTLLRNPALPLSQPLFEGKMNLSVQPIGWVAEMLYDAIAMEDQSKNSNVIILEYQDHETSRALDILNTLVWEYNREQSEVRRQRTVVPLDFIESRIRNVLSELDQTEAAIKDFKYSHQLTDIEFDMQFYIDQMQDIQSQLISTEAEDYVISMMEDFVRNPDNRYHMVPLLFSVRDGESGNSALILYNETLLERTQLLRSARPESPLVLRLEDQLDRIREGVIQSVAQAHAGYKQTLNELRRRERLIRDKMGQVPVLENEYVNYKRRQEIFQGIYLILLQKREELALTVGQLQDRARVVEQPFIKRQRTAPRKLYAGLGVLFFTLFVPVTVLFFRKQYIVLRNEWKQTD
ncbi:MAG: tyrosine protein kinase [Tannerellaceae bacterium]|jgi:uncharacterized protein involved in exopolysaccharide biosynthesis|nr:tyrosine protein kinase [Tannerellaceae bacterium]